MATERAWWSLRDHRIEILWGAFALANLAVMSLVPRWETVPFHFIWVSLTIVFGYRVWRTRPTALVLTTVMAVTGLSIWIAVGDGEQVFTKQ